MSSGWTSPTAAAPTCCSTPSTTTRKIPSPYDDTGWTLGPLHNVKTVRVTDAKILDAAMALLGQDVAIEGRVMGKDKAVAFAVNHTAEPELMTFRYRLKDIKMLAAEDEFSQGGVKFVSGSFVIPAEGNPADLETRLGAAAKDLGLTVYRPGRLFRTSRPMTSTLRGWPSSIPG